MREASRRIATLSIACGMVLSFRCNAAVVIKKENAVEVIRSGGAATPATEGLVLVVQDKLGTGESSRAVLKMSAGWNARIDEETLIEITRGGIAALDRQMMALGRGQVFFYSREAKGEWRIQTPAGTGTGRGTQLVIRVLLDGSTFFQLLEGEFDFVNPHGSVALKPGEAGEATPNTAPRKTAVIETRNLLQWALYYPAVLPPTEFGLITAERQEVAASLEAYAQGDLPMALEKYPRNHAPTSAGAKLYRAAVLLATGQVDDARMLVQNLPAEHSGRRALERMLAAVLLQDQPSIGSAPSAGEALAESYYRQSRWQLEAARTMARRSTELAPQSGYAWTRLAELEFSFGRTRAAWHALDRGLKLTPRNAQAHALRGFLFSAENDIETARASFERATQLDGALGNGWLGLGLTKIRQGQLAAGRSDLQMAVTVEPTRSFLYSYHAKAIGLDESMELAAKDLALAKQLDPADPTPWLYTAIHKQQENRYNAAIEELHESLRRNDNRQLYRSRFLLDQDRAVRSTNLASIYQHNGMTDLAVREATRAVESEYANASAHQFLANSFDALRDPGRLSLRHETAWFNEQLLAQLLAPVGGGSLSQFVSQQEYSKLLEADGFGGTSITEWRERGYLDQQLSLFGTKGRLSLALDYAYHDDPGFRPNNDTLRKEVYGQVKYQVTGDDILYTLGKWQDQTNGDLLQSHDNLPLSFESRYEDRQEPGLLLLGWNHRWAPGAHTLILGGRLAANETYVEPASTRLLVERDELALQPDFLRPGAGGMLEFTAAGLRNAIPPALSNAPDGALTASNEFRQAIAPFLGRAPATGVFTDRFDLEARRKFAIHSVELQHLWQTGRHTVIAGARAQAGEIKAQVRLGVANPDAVPFFTNPAALQSVALDFERVGVYAYDFFVLNPWLTVLAGAAWDRVDRPENFRQPPVSMRQVESEKTSGKLGFTLIPSPAITVRGVYSESMGGVSFDETVRLEPVQLAGFNQAFRTVIAESLVGSVEAPVYKNVGVSASGAAPTRTWWSLSFNRIDEDVERVVGAFDIFHLGLNPERTVALPAGTTEMFAYREEVVAVGVNQLIGNELSVGAKYRQTRAKLRTQLSQILGANSTAADRFDRATLREAALYANWNSPEGWFARGEANHFAQTRDSAAGGAATVSLPGDAFWHANAQVGYRFRRNRQEWSGGIFNLTDRDYHLSPLTYFAELPHDRTFFVRVRVSF